MPEINIAPPPSPVPPSPGSAAPAADPAVQGPGAASGSSRGASEDKGASDFAKVLKKQIDEDAPSKAATAPSPATPAVPAVPAAQLTAEPALPAETPPADALASLLPMIFGNIATASKAKDPATSDASAPALPSGMPEMPVAAIAAPITTTPVPPLPAAPELAEQDRQPSGRAVSAQPAILAATVSAESSEAGTEIAAAGQEPSFEALLSRHTNDSESARAAASSAIESAKSAMPATPAPAAARMGTPMGNPGWNNELGEKLVWMVGRQDSRAELVLNPPQLGRIEVSLTVNGDQASALFVSANPSVRESLENALPRLREILLDAGITLGQTQVGSESANHSADNNGDNGRRNGGRGQEAHPVVGTATIEPAQWMRRGNGLVDTFA